MGQEAQPSTLPALAALGAFLGALLVPASSPAASVSWAVRSSYELQSEPLTTEKAWMLDPGEANPHRVRWILVRHVDLKDFRSVAKGSSGDHFGVELTGLESLAQGYVRGEGPWFRPMEEFPCNSKPRDWFATQEGSKRALGEAAEVWDRALRSEVGRLAALLQKVDAPTSELAIERAERHFRNWLWSVERDFKSRVPGDAAQVEWRFYSQQASESVCKRGASAARAVPRPPAWRDMMEPPAGGPPTPSVLKQLLSRAPAKRWGAGVFSVRLAVSALSRTLNGQFLVDSGAASSLVAPAWIEAQGFNRSLIVLPGLPPRSVSFLGPWHRPGGLAPRVSLESVDLGGLPLALDDFAMTDTDFFDPPETLNSCCDGVLGTDFFQKFVVEVVPGPPPEIKVWTRESFHLGAEHLWVEAHLTPEGEIVSSCSLTPSGASGSSSTRAPVSLGIRWDTGSEAALEVHAPFRSQIRPGPWDLSCDGQWIGRGLRARTTGGGGEGPFRSSYPGATVGIQALARGPVVFDLPHGRVWFRKDTLLKPPVQNGTGVVVEYGGASGKRSLLVRSAGKTPATSSLRAQGFGVGTEILEIQGKPADEMDSFDVEQLLAGSQDVELKFKTRNGGPVKKGKLSLGQKDALKAPAAVLAPGDR